MTSNDRDGGMAPCVAGIPEVRAAIADARAVGSVIGLVPTMGAFHEGHLSLIRKARAECGFVVVWVFVNPAQFGPSEDLDRYPRDLDRDRLLAAEAGADLVFAPTAGDIYPEGFSTWVDVEGITEGLCGASRPGHFRGVCTVVTKFFNICAPDRAYFGQKDAQQLAVIRRMVRDLNMPIEIVACPIVREADGLALSSRNVYLSEEERRQALALSRSLDTATALVAAGERDADVIGAQIERVLMAAAPLGEIDYIAVVDAEDLEPVETITGETLIALAVRFGGTRLIDNTVVQP